MSECTSLGELSVIHPVSLMTINHVEWWSENRICYSTLRGDLCDIVLDRNDDDDEIKWPPCNPGVLFACSTISSSSSSFSSSSDCDDDSDDDSDDNENNDEMKVAMKEKEKSVKHFVLLVDSIRQLMLSHRDYHEVVSETMKCITIREVDSYTKYLHCIHEREYGAASSLAKKYGFNTDEMYVYNHNSDQ